MKNIKFIIIGIIALVLLSGCFQVKRIIKINKDGSGTIEETVLITQQFIDQMKQMTGGYFFVDS